MKTAQQSLLNTYATSYPTADQSIGEQTTNDKGQATFTVDRKNGKSYQVYLFFETKSPANATKKQHLC